MFQYYKGREFVDRRLDLRTTKFCTRWRRVMLCDNTPKEQGWRSRVAIGMSVKQISSRAHSPSGCRTFFVQGRRICVDVFDSARLLSKWGYFT